MAEPIPVDILIYDQGTRIRIKAVLDNLTLNAISYGGRQPSGNSSYPIPIGSSFTLAARVSDWLEKDGRPVFAQAAPAPAATARDTRSDRRSRRLARRERARRRAASEVHGDRAG